MKMFNKYIGLFAVFLSAGIFMACDKDDNKSAAQARGQFYLTDAPGEFEEVNIDIQSLELKTDFGTQVVAIQEGVYNLLELTNGLDTLLGETVIEGTTMNQIRLVLGDNNTVVVDGETHALTTPSAQQSGLKINLNQSIVAGNVYAFTLDFDASQSIVLTGNGKYILKPVIKTFVNQVTTGIAGVVEKIGDVDFLAPVKAISGTDTVGTFATVGGDFKILNLSEGTYTVIAGYDADTAKIDGVVVTEGNVTQIDTLVIN